MKRILVAASLSTAVVMRAGSAPATAVPVSYDVELKFTGISGHHIEKAADCAAPVSATGYDLLVGTVTGDETSAPDDDVEYSGVLQRSTVMDFCELKGRRGPNDDERVDCAARLVGSAVMQVIITVYSDAGRGAWLEATPAPGATTSTVTGGCDPAEINQIRSDYPGSSHAGGGSPNGQAIDDSSSKLSVAGVARLQVGNYPPVYPNVWALRVIKRLP